ncbi:MAG: DUF3592 domain-containing protein, partial [Deltaproteobacteria bacterium]
ILMWIWVVVMTLGLIVMIVMGVHRAARWWRDKRSPAPSSSAPPSEAVVDRPTPPRRPGVSFGGCGLLFGLGWTAFSLIFVIVPLGLLITELHTAILLQTTGVTTEAVVISRRIDEDSEDDTYYVTYDYWVPLPQGDRARLTQEESVDSDTYQVLVPESRVTVRYAATSPEVARLKGQSKVFEVILLIAFMLFGGLFVAIGVWLVYSAWQDIHNGRVLAQHGEIITGNVTDRWIETDSDGDKEYCVAFCFSVPGEPEITTAEINRTAYDTLQEGDSVQVRYVPGKPEICRLEM